MPDDVLDTEDESADPSFDLDSSMRCDSDHLIETSCDVWVTGPDRDDRMSLDLFLTFQLTNLLGTGRQR